MDVVGLNINQADTRTRRRLLAGGPIRISVTPLVWCRGAIRSYNSLQTTFDRRMGAVRFTGAWTWAHSIDNTSGESSNTPDSEFPQPGGAAREFDVRHPP